MSVSIIMDENQEPARVSKIVEGLIAIGGVALLLGTLKYPLAHHTSAVHYGVTSRQGRRQSQEDRVVFDIGRKFSIFAVYDGHGGSSCATFLAQHLHKELRRAITFYYSSDAVDLRGALHLVQLVFQQVDEAWLRKAIPARDDSGSTATVCIVDHMNHQALIAWTGDSDAMICTGSSARRVTRPHTAAAEEARLTAAGLVIMQNRVMPLGLAVSRAFGDYQIKKVKLGGVICDPEVEIVSFDPQHDAIVLASDGLWDVVDVDTAAGIASGETSAQRVADLLADMALERASTDNVSVICVKDAWTAASVPHSRL
eukprot:TRINITY_DN2066_c0_g6_i1.p1 TRINITY_DN2066_c0_g6~~TRINITY_DN2066_c0_g6_i1.p1  ORF type:complete len:313 (+),score=59.90 TRINITY_DN2066_c0_g6_i1:730-1668(+)